LAFGFGIEHLAMEKYGITDNIEDVDQMEIQGSKRILQKMNYNERFELKIIYPKEGNLSAQTSPRKTATPTC